MAFKRSKFTAPDAEHALMSGIAQYSGDAFVDVDDLLDVDSIQEDWNRDFYACAHHFFAEDVKRKLDYHSLLSTARKLGLPLAADPATKQRWRALINYPIHLDTVRSEAAKLFKLATAKELDQQVAEIRRNLHGVSGDESIGEILAIAENPIFDFTARINGDDKGVRQIAQGGREWLRNIFDNPNRTIGVQSPFAQYNRLIGGGFRRKGISVVAARAKTGKSQPLTSLVFTPNGPILMGEITPGDIVSTPQGATARVLSVHPQGVRDIYRVVFADGDSTECDLEHLWEVKHNRKSLYQVMTLREIVARGLMDGDHRKWRVRLPETCYYEEQHVPMDPYMLGLLIGNGGMSQQQLTFTTASGGRNQVQLTLSSLGLAGKTSHDKFIPDVYKYNTREVRLALLQGLFDTDGSAAKDGYSLEYSTASRRLAGDVKEVVQSLGGLCSLKGGWTTRQTGKSWSYRLLIKHNDGKQFFRLSRKKDRMKIRKKDFIHRAILRVEYIGRRQTQCIMIDSPDNLYMTDHHIVTHNTIWCDNVCLHVAGTLGIPVFNIDTEMDQDEHLARILGHICNIDSLAIDEGRLSNKEKKALAKAMEWLETIPYDYESVVDSTFDEQVASMRRWTIKNVGVDADGRRKDGLLVYDYLQMTNPDEFYGDFKEHQILGFQMVALQKMAKRCDIPVLSMLQVNREGITKETTAVAAGSDRIIWKCANFSILKKKDESDSHHDEGQLKLINLIARHGPGAPPGDYINIKFDGATSRMTEGKTRYELEKAKGRDKGGFEIAESKAGDIARELAAI